MEEEQVSPAYQKGFNNGYQMAVHEPELLHKILKSGDQKNEYVRAMIAGKRQHELEKIKDQEEARKQKLGQGHKPKM